MKIGCGTVLFRKFELERSLAAIRETGFEYFETQAVGPWCPHVDVTRDDPAQLVRLREKYGFKGITGLWSPDGNLISNENSVASGIRAVEWAAAAGIPVLHTGDGHKPAGMSDDEAFVIFADKLARILEAARRWGVMIAIEPHGAFSLTAHGLTRILSLGGADCLGINYDGCNIFRAGYVESGNGTSAWRSNHAPGTGASTHARSNHAPGGEVRVLEAVADRVIHCHVKDIDGAGQCVAVGDGLVDNGGCIDVLRRCGYDGVLSVETEGGDDFDAVCALARRSREAIEALLY